MAKPFAPPSLLINRFLSIFSPRHPTALEQFTSMPAAQNNNTQSVEMRDCIICAESKLAHRDFLELSTCDHGTNTCVDCFLAQAIVVIEQRRRWDALKCPTCSSKVNIVELFRMVARSNSTAHAELMRLEALVKETALMQSPNWRWCLSPGCGHGQIYLASQVLKSQMVECDKCKAHSCFRHQVKWHSGYTCENYDLYHPNFTITKSDREFIKKTTKACPNCSFRIQKDGGCNHMICPQCNGTFFWNHHAFDGENQPSSAEYAGGPQNPRQELDRETENVILAMEAGRPVRHLDLAMPQHRHERDFTLEPPPLPRTLLRPPPRLEPLMPPRRRGAVDLSTENDPFLRELVPNRALRRSPRLNNLSNELESKDDELEIAGDLEPTAARINNTSTRGVTKRRLGRIRAVAKRLISFSTGDREYPLKTMRSNRPNLLPLGLHESPRGPQVHQFDRRDSRTATD